MSLYSLTITIPGKPIAKARPRFFRRGNFVGTFNCQETEEGRMKWEIAHQFNREPIPSGFPIILHALFCMPIPGSMSKKRLSELNFSHVKKPDTDNLVKFIKDCGNGVLWVDDSQVCDVHARKIYDQNPRTEITLEW
jgi:Holliday junction resolvase RusA-like endonuclease